MDAFLTDVRHTAQGLRRSPWFTVFAATTLALGIGANVVMFSVARRALFDPVPFPTPHRVMSLSEDHSARGGSAFERVSLANFGDWQTGTASFTAMAAFTPWSTYHSDGDAAREIIGVRVTPEAFAIMGFEPKPGRGFAAEDAQVGATPVVVVSDAFWRDHLGAVETLAGLRITLDGTQHVVVGVLPASAEFVPIDGEAPVSPTVWGIAQTGTECRLCRTSYVLGLLREGVSSETAQAELATTARGMAEVHPETNRDVGVSVVALADRLIGPIRPALTTLIAAVGLVLLVACANVANLILARSTTRRGELALRAALGANRRRLVRQVLTESMLLAFCGAGIGVLFAAWGWDLFLATIPSTIHIPRMAGTTIDDTALFFAVALAAVAGLLVGILPSVHGSNPDPAGPLTEIDRRIVAPIGGSKSRGMLVVIEVAVSLILLVGAGMLVVGYARLASADPGLESDRLLTLELASPIDVQSDSVAAYRQAIESLSALPGVERVAMASRAPFSRSAVEPTTLVERRGGERGDGVPAIVRAVTPGYVATTGMALRWGRDLTERDASEPTRPLLVNRTLARWLGVAEEGGERRIRIDGAPALVVGVVDNLRSAGEVEERPVIYRSADQFGGSLRAVLVRTHGDPAEVAGAVRETFAERLTGPPPTTATMNELIAATTAPQRLTMVILVVFAAVSLTLAAVGLYGALSYSLAQRSHEIGLRMALGANPSWLTARFVGEALGLAAGGTALGMAVSLGSTALIAGNVFGVALEPLVFAVGPAVVLAVAGAAGFVPAHRAANINPMAVLRNR